MKHYDHVLDSFSYMLGSVGRKKLIDAIVTKWFWSFMGMGKPTTIAASPGLFVQTVGRGKRAT